MKNTTKVLAFLIILFFLLGRKAYADGVQLSSTSVGSSATLTSQLPADPCGVHKLGETKNRTVVGFAIATTPFNMGDDQVMRIVNEKRADLTNAVVSDFTISGRKITDFKSNPVDYSTLNWQDFIHYHRTFNLNTPIEFTPQDTASIVVSNVKISNKGTIKPEFALLEPNGQFCLGAKYTILTLGDSQKPIPITTAVSTTTRKLPLPSVTSSKPTFSITPTKVLSPTNSQTVKTSKEVAINTKAESLSPIQVVINFFRNLFRVVENEEFN